MDTQLYVDGRFVPAEDDARFDVINPATEDMIGTAADASAQDVAAAVSAARRAADESGWATDHQLRRRRLEQLQAACVRLPQTSDRL